MGHHVKTGSIEGGGEGLHRSVQADIVMLILRPHQLALHKAHDEAEQEEFAQNPGFWSPRYEHDMGWVPDQAVQTAAQDLPSSLQDLLSRNGKKRLDRDHDDSDFDLAIQFILKAATLKTGVSSC